MPYFTAKQGQSERICKIVADVVCAILLATFSIVFFGVLGGILAFAILEVCLLALDWVMPSEDDAAGAVR